MVSIVSTQAVAADESLGRSENSVFMFGMSRTLGDPIDLDTDPAMARCVKKEVRKTMYCLEAITWPDDVAALLLVRDVALFKGTQAITAYQPIGADHNYRATRYFQPFDPGGFDGLRAYLIEMLGRPSNDWVRVVRRPGEGEIENHVVRWRIIHGEEEARTIFEIQRHNTNVISVHGTPMGSLRLYKEGANTIFPGMRTSDLAILSARFIRARTRIDGAKAK